MNNLGLPHPKQIDVAVPANLRCGQPGRRARRCRSDPDWAPLRFTFAGIWEVAAALARGAPRATVQVLDVREPDEFTGPLGHIRGATLIPLGELADARRRAAEATSRSSRSAAPAAARRRPR